MRPTSESRRYNVTSSLIGGAHAQNDPWLNILIHFSIASKPADH